MKQNSNQTTERWGIRYTGIVQGVGFRPLVSMCAHSLGLTGLYIMIAAVYMLKYKVL